MPKLLSILFILFAFLTFGCGQEEAKSAAGDDDEAYTSAPKLKRSNAAEEDESPPDDETDDESEEDDSADDEPGDDDSNTDDDSDGDTAADTADDSLSQQASKLADDICDCKDIACAKALIPQGVALEKKAADGSEADRDAVAAAKKRAKGCVRVLRDAPAPPEVPADPPTADPPAAADTNGQDCNGDNAIKCFNQAMKHQLGTGVEKNLGTAISLYSGACDGGESRGCMMAAGLHMQGGKGLDKDKKKAGQFYAKACALGQKTACATAKMLGATTDSVDESPKVADEAPVAAKPPVQSAGPAYFGLAGRGLVKLDKGGVFDVVVGGLDSVTDIELAADGVVWMLANYSKLYRVANGKSKKIGSYKEPGSLSKITLQSDGTLWATSYKGLWQFDGSDWKMTPKEELGEGVKSFKDITTDGKNRVWVSSYGGLFVRDNGKWTTVDISGLHKNKIYIEELQAHADGTVLTGSNAGVIRLGAGAPALMPTPGITKFDRRSLKYLASSKNNTVHAATFSGVLYQLNADGTTQAKRSAKDNDFKGSRIQTMASDTQGRSWLATDHGLVVMGSDGNKTQYAPGTVGALAGEIKVIRVVGDGPSLPAVGPVRTGAVTGKVLRGGEPVSGIPIEICGAPSMILMKGESPCSNAPYTASVSTDESGNFRFNDVPAGGTFRFAVKGGDKWSLSSFSSNCCSKLKPGKSFDIGSLTLKEK